MGATHHFNPFIRRDLIGAQNSAHFRIKHFGGCAGQRRKTFGFQPTEEILQRQAESLRSMSDFQWRKSMDMNVRRARPYGSLYIEIGIADIGWVNVALKAYPSRAAVHRFSHAATHFLNIHTIEQTAHATSDTHEQTPN